MEENNSLGVEEIEDKTCDICSRSTQLTYGLLKAEWGSNPNEKYTIYLCKSCFLGTLYYLRNQKKMIHLFDEFFDFTQLDNLGLS
ncbi:hypothetical protein Q5X30_18080 [Acinetobacter baumannii]|uniref:hypothetical protein n=1 Tax=Acinetobacter nosocomialis TaxID=106654 RepID=UPI00124CE158|nr:hypothetical protein [Acinetobacter nosocomialis]MDO7355975.1 hypothetical protein [Acinetobacter baumannii]MDO7406305.1 hypothetical protein [Acinetobacter baumannii]